MAYYICYNASPLFSKAQKKIFRWLCLILYGFLIMIGILAIVSGNIRQFMGLLFTDTGSAYASSITILSIFWLMNTNCTIRDRIYFLLMITIALISGKSRFYGFYVVSIFYLFWGKKFKIKFSFKNLLFIVLIVSGSVFVAWNKIRDNFMPTEAQESARLLLYENSINIFSDYLPFGSGFASYATEASRRPFYSAIYDKYGISSIWGLSRTHDSFITDTYFPSLAQFGIIGLCLFIFFWFFIIKEFNKYVVSCNFLKNKFQLIFLLIISFLFIESTANAILTSGSGMVMMSFLGLLLGNKKKVFIIENSHLIEYDK